MAELLLSCGALPNAKDSASSMEDYGGITPLHLAAEKGFNAVIEVLLSNKADIEAKRNNGQTPLRSAVISGQQATVELLLRKGADVNAADKSGVTPIFSARDEGILKLLIEAKADVNVQDQNGYTPLSRAVGSPSPGLVKALLDAKADPNLTNKLGFPPLYVAVNNNRIEEAGALLEAKANANPALVGNTLLSVAVGRTNAAMVELLLRYGASPNAEMRNASRKEGGKWTALHRAAYFGIVEVVPALIRAGASADLPDAPEKNTPLHYAAGNSRILEMLLAGKPNVNVSNQSGDTPLHWAACANGPEPAALLLSHGAGVNAVNAKGQTPLHLASWKRSQEIMQLLLTNQADPNIRDNEGHTSLDVIASPFHNTFVPAPGVVIPQGSPAMFPMALNRQGSLAGTPIAPNAQVEPQLAQLLRKHGASDDLPKPDRIEVRRGAAGASSVVFLRSTNNWNRFTLFETIYNFYQRPPPWALGDRPTDLLPFPDLTRVVVIHRAPNSRETRKEINLFDGPNRFDCTRDVPLEFGDVVEIPERVHSLDERPEGLTADERRALTECLAKGNVQLQAGNRELKQSVFPRPSDSLIGEILGRASTRQFLLSNSDLSRVKVKRTYPGTGETREWVLDCSNPNRLPDLWLRDGDVIEVPEKR